jgi:hypothetical protein
MVKMKDLEDGIQVNWQQVDDIASGLSIGKFEDWREINARYLYQARRARRTVRTVSGVR